MGPSDLERHRETRITMRLIIASEEPTEQATAAASSLARALRLRYPLVLALSILGALIPFFAPLGLMSAIPRLFVVAWYGLLAAVAGGFGIMWILLTARLIFSTKGEAGIDLDDEARNKVFEVLHSTVRGVGR